LYSNPAFLFCEDQLIGFEPLTPLIMKTVGKLLALMLATSLAIGTNSCEKNSGDNSVKGKLEISLSVAGDEGQLKSALNDTLSNNDSTTVLPMQAIVSLQAADGSYILEDELVPVYRFGDGLVSGKIEIPVGDFSLTKFLVVDPAGNVVFASPLTDAPLAYLVNKPLPLSVSIKPGETTRIVPEVLRVVDQTPEDFGYASFGFQVVSPLVFYTVAVLENPIYMEPLSSADKMAPIVFTTAELTVFNNAGWSYTFKLEPVVNKIIVRGGSAYYTLVVKKEGYEPVKLQVPAKELMATTKENPLVLRIGEKPLLSMVFQPGPEKGVDAMISNLDPEKNFGLHKYFEATFMSEPVLTVMRSNRSLIWFNLGMLPKSATIKKVNLTLYYDKPVIWDATASGSVMPPERYGAALQQVVSPWKEDSVTWNNQPKTTEANQVIISPFIRNVNFIDVDVTTLFVPRDKINLPNYGMMLKLYPEENFPGFRFASSDFPEPAMRPKLTVFYSLP
jgi:hypothetical protein